MPRCRRARVAAARAALAGLLLACAASLLSPPASFSQAPAAAARRSDAARETWRPSAAEGGVSGEVWGRRLAVSLPLQLQLAALHSLVGAPPAAVADEQAVKPGTLAVLGATGRTGRLCVEALRSNGEPVLALARAELDVVKAPVEAIADAVRGADAVIFACSASSKGGNAALVDEQAAIKAAEACKLAGIPKYVLISSGGVARPGSLGYLATNWMPGPTWGMMDAKARGEEGVKSVLRGSNTRYAVLRPGGLEDSTYLGPAEMELNQGDAVGGLVSRADVAACAVAAARSPDTDDTTFELYAHSAFSQGPGSTDGFGGAVGKTGYERRGKSWPELFHGLKKEFSKL